MEVDKEKKKVKIHFKGYSNDTDEWRDYGEESNILPFERLERAYIPDEVSLEDRTNSFHGQLYREIKRKLWSSRREDPDVRIEVNVDPDVFSAGLGRVVKPIHYRGKEVYSIKENNCLNGLLGLKWNERILNQNSDFSYVVKGTVKYWLSQRNSIVEYKYIGGKYVKSEIEDSHFVVFSFVRGDGNRGQYLCGNF